jgi:hypothetical protein
MGLVLLRRPDQTKPDAFGSWTAWEKFLKFTLPKHMVKSLTPAKLSLLIGRSETFDAPEPKDCSFTIAIKLKFAEKLFSSLSPLFLFRSFVFFSFRTK